MPDCTTLFPLPIATGKKVYAAFDMSGLTSDGGISFIRSVDDRLGLTASLAPLLPDPRDPRYVTHTALDLLRQRVYSIIAGYEDLNDAQRLRGDPALELAVGRDALDLEPTWVARPRHSASSTRSRHGRLHSRR